MADDPNRTPYTGQFGMQPSPPANTPPPTAPKPPPYSDGQLASYHGGTPPPPTANTLGASVGGGIGAGNNTPPPAPPAQSWAMTPATGVNAYGNLGYGGGLTNQPGKPWGPGSEMTAGGYQEITTGNTPMVINPDTGQPYQDQISAPKTFFGSGGISQFGNPNLALLGGDPNNLSSSMGGQGSYANVQNQRLQGMAGNIMGRTGPQLDTGATNMFATGTGNAIQHADSTNLLGISALQNANATNLLADRQGLDLAALANGQGSQGQFASADQLAALGRLPAGPSVAQAQLKMGAEDAMRQQMAMASGARGGNAALALQNAGENAGAVNAQMNGQQAILRAQEDMANRQFAANANQAAGNLYGQAAQTQTGALSNAANVFGNVAANQLGQGNAYTSISNNQLGQANLNLGLTNTYADLAGKQLGANVSTQGQNDATALGLMGMGYGLQTSDRNAALAREQELMDLNARLYGINRGADEQANQRNSDNMFRWLGAGTSAAGSMIAMSDVRAKKDIKPANGAVSEAFRAANNSANAIQNTNVPYPTPAYSYQYKNPNAPGAAPGTHYGPMAQDLERTPAGASVVVNKPNGMKGIDTNRLSLLNASELSNQRQELDAIQGRAPMATSITPKTIGVGARAPMQRTINMAPRFGSVPTMADVQASQPNHREVIGVDMDGNPVLANGAPQASIGFQPGQLGYSVGMGGAVPLGTALQNAGNLTAQNIFGPQMTYPQPVAPRI